MASPTTTTDRRSRRAHIKSRRGCKNCKKRKVKCSEERPSCRNCLRRAEYCDLSDESLNLSRPEDYASASTPAPLLSAAVPLPAVVSRDGTDSLQLTMLDMELLHHFTTSTCLTISTDPIIRNFMRVNLPPIGFSHPYVLYGTLALAALHLARFRLELKEYYIAQAETRHATAASMATTILSDISSSSADRGPIFLFSTLTSYIAFASPKEPSHLISSTHAAMPNWLSLFRGIRTVIELQDIGTDFQSLSCLFQAGQEVKEIWDSQIVEHDALKELEHSIKTSTTKDEQTMLLLNEAIDGLKRAFSLFYGRELSSDKKASVAFIWMYRIPEGFLALLRQRDTEALCVLAFFCVLLNKLEHNWWIDGWAVHLMERIYAAIDDLHRLWIRWPIEELGWIPRPLMSSQVATPT